MQLNSLVTSWHGLNILCRYKPSVVRTEVYNVMVNSDELIGTIEYLTVRVRCA
jgi:hypothetical protein